MKIKYDSPQRASGFTNHGLMGATFFAGMWAALYFPHLLPVFKLGGAYAAIAIAASIVAIIGIPVFLYFQGDELQGIVGFLLALASGWAAARIALAFELPPAMVESARLCGAALVPAAICLVLLLLLRD